MVKFNSKLNINSDEAVQELRKMILDGIEAGDAEKSVGSFHPDDIQRIHNDQWLDNFLFFHDYNVKAAFTQCWNTLEWRKKANVNEIREDSVKKEDLIDGNIYFRGRDLDGKHIMYFRIRIYFRGSRTIEDMQTFFLYWVERGLRLSKGDKITLVLDMQRAGLRNQDLEYTRMMIGFFRNYYPNTMNYMLIYDMPFIMNGIFQIIKGLLPKKVLDRLKFINSKNASQYIPPEHMPVEWGGLDAYELKFESENEVCDEKSNDVIENNNDSSQVNLNLPESKKVHFASFQDSTPMTDSSSYENHFGDMLSLSPAEVILFQKNGASIEYTGNVEILNISKKPITYKVKTTAPDKFRVRPSSGTLSPNNSATINVVIQKGQHMLPINKDKFLVMCMSLPDGESLTADEITNMWKEVTSASPDVEQHRLKCALPVNVTTAIINNDAIGDYFLDNNPVNSSMHHNLSTAPHNGTKHSSPMSQQHLQATVSHLTDSMNHMQQQIKSLQSLQWITIFVFIMLAIAIVYILKMEIQNQNSQYCIDK